MSRRALLLGALGALGALILGDACGDNSGCPSVQVTVQRTGEGQVTSTPLGVSCGAQCQVRLCAGQPLQLSAQALWPGAFLGWQGACSGDAPRCAVDTRRDQTVSAAFGHQLTLRRDGDGEGQVRSDALALDCGPRCSAALPRGARVTLSARPAAGSFFAGWDGACQGTAPSCALRVEGALAATARFARRLCGADGFCWQHPLPQGNTLLAVFGLDRGHQWAAGAGGTLLFYDGVTWKLQESGTTEPLYGLWAGAADAAWAVGARGTILRWDGRRWQRQAAPTQEDLYTIWGSGAAATWAGGNALLRWDGAAWVLWQGAGAPRGARSIWGSAPTDVWFAGAPSLRFDGSVFRQQSALSGCQGQSVWGVAAVDLWLTGAAGQGVRRWNGATCPQVLAQDLDRLWAGGAAEAWAVRARASSELWRWDGLTWERDALQPALALQAVGGSPGGPAWAVGAGGFMTRLQDGAAEVYPAQPPPLAINALWASPTGELWAAGDRGAIRRWSEDGAAQVVQSGTTQDLLGLWGSAAGELWAVGWDRTVLRFDGAGFQPLRSSIDVGLRAVAGDGQGSVFVGGECGVWRINGPAVVKIAEDCVDALWSGPGGLWSVGRGAAHRWDGTRWRDFEAGGAWLTGVWGSGPDDVWLVGGGAVLRWDGADLRPVETGRNQALSAVWGRGRDDVWLAGEDQVLHFDGAAFTPASHGTVFGAKALAGSGGGRLWVAATQALWSHEAAR